MSGSSAQRRITLGLLAALIALDTAVRLVEKVAVLHAHATAPAALAVRLLRQPWWWLGLALGPLQLWTWTRLLARTELSLAYPLSSLGYPLTMVAAWGVFGEHLRLSVWLGAGLITAGAALVGSAAGHRQAAASPRACLVTQRSPSSDATTSALQPMR